MNRYPWWKYLILGIALVVGLLYTAPNFFGEAPAVQVSSAKATIKVDAAVQQRVEAALAQAIPHLDVAIHVEPQEQAELSGVPVVM